MGDSYCMQVLDRLGTGGSSSGRRQSHRPNLRPGGFLKGTAAGEGQRADSAGLRGREGEGRLGPASPHALLKAGGAVHALPAAELSLGGQCFFKRRPSTVKAKADKQGFITTPSFCCTDAQ